MRQDKIRFELNGSVAMLRSTYVYLVVFPSTWCTRTYIFSIKYSHQQIYIYAHCFRSHSTPCMIYRPLRKVLITTTTAYSFVQENTSARRIPFQHCRRRLTSTSDRSIYTHWYHSIMFISVFVIISHFSSFSTSFVLGICYQQSISVCAVCSTKLWTKSFSSSNFKVLERSMAERKQHSFCSCPFWANQLKYHQRFDQSIDESRQKLSGAIITFYDLQKTIESHCGRVKSLK